MSTSSAAYAGFMASTDIDYEKWHEGEGYDLDALRELKGAELIEVEQWLVDRAANDWRDIEALLAIGSDRAVAAVLEQLRHGTLEQRLWAARYLTNDPEVAARLPGWIADRDAAVVAGLGSAVLVGGLTQALDLAVELRTPAMVRALWRATQRDESEASVHAAARLAFLYGKATSNFDWDLRPLFLRFGTADKAERASATVELARLCGVDPASYLEG
jgi:hypothetical protein